MRRLDLVVAVDQFHTDTTAFAHYILPSKTMFEEEDLVTAYWHPYVQLRAKIFDPPGEVRTETAIWQQLCERFGFDTSYFPADRRTLLQAMLPGGQPGLLDALRERPIDPSGLGDVAFADRRFPTPSGKVEFASEEAARIWGVDPVPDFVPLDEGHDAPAARQVPAPASHLQDTRPYPLAIRQSRLGARRRAPAPAWTSTRPTRAARGLEDGTRAVVWNDRGRVEIVARLDHGIRPGVVHILEGRCHDGDPDVNLLTDAGVTDMNHGATFYECLVEVARA